MSANSVQTPSKVLFLCSGNYYRSRFAEHLFNHLAAQQGIGWIADSYGLVVDRPNNNVGPMSERTIDALTARNVPIPASLRFPMQLTDAHLAASDLVIALKEEEHRPMLAERFPVWAERTEYWHIHDLDKASAEVALAEIEDEVRRLVARLSS
ncbi:MAG: low molecular weight phosphatase family protein [Caldilineaceae bacterium]|nr:low molecular weight phosphatase family protein [Caldilineaceae bacterium]